MQRDKMAESGGWQTKIVPANTMELISKPGSKAQIWENFGLKKANDESGINDGIVYC